MKEINKLINYAINKNLLVKRDIIFCVNQLMYLLGFDEDFEFTPEVIEENIDDILNDIVNKYSPNYNNTEKELLKSKIISVFMDKPSKIQKDVYALYEEDPKKATDYFYNLSKDVNYIKTKQIKKNINFEYKSKYGNLYITINLSKPEKSLEEIKKAKESSASSKWVKCFLCKEEEGNYGSMNLPDRSNHRLIELDLEHGEWFFQYSPYSYYNEHSIVFSKEHTPMKINKNTFENLVSFVDKVPHYMIGSNADLPIVGGSMLSHDHYQAGAFDFPIYFANTLSEFSYKDCQIKTLDWPLSTIKIESSNEVSLIEVATIFFKKWKTYNNEQLSIYSKTSEQHNTITPIVRFIDGKYEMYLMLRNNITTKEHPDGLFHPHSDKHHIKRENIGLIEAIGLAVLPGRLESELKEIVEVINAGEKLPQHLKKHQTIYDQVKDLDSNNTYEEVLNIVGNIFEKVLEDCGVFAGSKEEFDEFIKDVIGE